MTADLDTKEKILNSALKSLSEKGFHATSTRQITEDAGVNLASVNYHFGSKENLFFEVCKWKLDPINANRIEKLNILEAKGPLGPQSLEGILEAFLEPALVLCQDEEGGPSFMRLMGRIFIDPGKHWAQVFELFAEVKERFFKALTQALPELDMDTFLWRFHFMLGAMCHTLADHQRKTIMPEQENPQSDINVMLEQLTTFLCAGLRAPTKEGNK